MRSSIVRTSDHDGPAGPTARGSTRDRADARAAEVGSHSAPLTQYAARDVAVRGCGTGTKKGRLHDHNRPLNWCGAKGIRTPDLLHAIYEHMRMCQRKISLVSCSSFAEVRQGAPRFAAVAALGCCTRAYSLTFITVAGLAWVHRCDLQACKRRSVDLRTNRAQASPGGPCPHASRKQNKGPLQRGSATMAMWTCCNRAGYRASS